MIQVEIKNLTISSFFHGFSPKIIKKQENVSKSAWKEIQKKQILQNDLLSSISRSGKMRPLSGSDKCVPKLKLSGQQCQGLNILSQTTGSEWGKPGGPQQGVGVWWETRTHLILVRVHSIIKYVASSHSSLDSISPSENEEVRQNIVCRTDTWLLYMTMPFHASDLHRTDTNHLTSNLPSKLNWRASQLSSGAHPLLLWSPSALHLVLACDHLFSASPGSSTNQGLPRCNASTQVLHQGEEGADCPWWPWLLGRHRLSPSDLGLGPDETSWHRKTNNFKIPP